MRGPFFINSLQVLVTLDPCGSYVEVMWNSCGSHVEVTWNSHGSHMEVMWKSHVSNTLIFSEIVI